MDAETFLGAILIAAWAAVVVRGLEQTAVAAGKGRKWERAYLVGLGVGCAFGVGVVLSIKNSLPLDTFALGFFVSGGCWICDLGFWSKGPAGQKEGRSIKTADRADRGGWVGFTPDGVTGLVWIVGLVREETDARCPACAPRR
jgi:hypothetical protein